MAKILLSLFLCLMKASAVAVQKPPGSFSVQLEDVPEAPVRSLLEAHRRAVYKYNLTSRQGSRPADWSPVTSVPILNSAGDREFYAQVTVGLSPIRVLFDTGSADDWVLASNATVGDAVVRDRYYFNSPFAKDIPDSSFSLTYGDGTTVDGTVYTDSYTVGTTSLSNAAVEVANSVSEDVTNSPVGGILGLAFPILNQAMPRQVNWAFRVMSQLAAPVFCAAVSRAAPGTWDFGYIDRAKYTGPIRTFALSDTDVKHWTITASKAYIPGLNRSVGSNESLNTVADNGIPFVYLTDNTVAAYYERAPGSYPLGPDETMYTYDCSVTQPWPDLTITLGSVNETRYNVTIPGGQLQAVPGATATPSGRCIGLLQGNGGGDRQILGGPFYKNFFVIHNMRDRTLGVANRTGSFL